MKEKKNIFERAYIFFDKLEDKIRNRLSKRPIWYGIIGGVAVVLFWRGVWHTSDLIEGRGGFWAIVFSGPGSIILSLIILLMIGLFVSTFVGDMIIMSGLKQEKKVADKTEGEMKEEKLRLERLEAMVERVEDEVEEIHHEHMSLHRHDEGKNPQAKG